MEELSTTPDSATAAVTLSDDERQKVRELVRACTPESVELALSILDTMDGTTADWTAVFDRGILTDIVESWNPKIWDGLYRRLPARRKELFAALAAMRFVTASQRDWTLREKLDAVWEWACEWAWVAQANQGLRAFVRMQSSGPRWVFEQDFPWVTLGFVSGLDAEIVDAIVDFKGDVHLDSMSQLTVEQSRGLARHQGWLYCNGIAEISDDVADELVKHGPHVFLEGLTKLSHAGLAEKLASKPAVYLDELVSVSDDVVRVLVRSGTRVFARHISHRLAAIEE